MISALRGTGRLLHLGAATLGWVAVASAHQALVPPEARERVFQRYMQRWARSLVQSTGGRMELAPGSVVPEARGARLVVANHRSPFDVGILLSLFGGHALSRADLAGWPVLGLAARRAGTIFVEREDGTSRASALRTIRRRLQAGATVLLFPEGATFEGDEVRAFHPGALAALRGLDVEVVPVGLAYDPGIEFLEESFAAHVVRVAGRPHTRCVVRVGAPRLASGASRALADVLQRDVQALVSEAREHWRATEPSRAKTHR